MLFQSHERMWQTLMDEFKCHALEEQEDMHPSSRRGRRRQDDDDMELPGLVLLYVPCIVHHGFFVNRRCGRVLGPRGGGGGGGTIMTQTAL